MISTFGRGLVLALLFPLLTALPAEASHADRMVTLHAEDSIGATVAWSRHTFTTSRDVILGRADYFPDNLASGLIQGQGNGAPLLLAPRDGLDPRVVDEIERLEARVAHIVGGPDVVGPKVVKQLREMGLLVHRHHAPTRIGTAIEIAKAHAPDATTAILVRGYAPEHDASQAFADAIAGGAWSATAGYPILLNGTAGLNPAVADYLKASKIRRIKVVAGSAAIPDTVIDELYALGLKLRVQRISGPTRFATAIELNQRRGFTTAGDAREVVVAEAQDNDAWAGGIAAAAYAARNNAAVVVTNRDGVPFVAEEWLESAAVRDAGVVCAPLEDPETCRQTTRATKWDQIPDKVANVKATVTARRTVKVEWEWPRRNHPSAPQRFEIVRAPALAVIEPEKPAPEEDNSEEPAPEEDSSEEPQPEEGGSEEPAPQQPPSSDNGYGKYHCPSYFDYYDHYYGHGYGYHYNYGYGYGYENGYGMGQGYDYGIGYGSDYWQQVGIIPGGPSPYNDHPGHYSYYDHSMPYGYYCYAVIPYHGGYMGPYSPYGPTQVEQPKSSGGGGEEEEVSVTKAEFTDFGAVDQDYNEAGDLLVVTFSGAVTLDAGTKFTVNAVELECDLNVTCSIVGTTVRIENIGASIEAIGGKSLTAMSGVKAGGVAVTAGLPAVIVDITGL